MSITLRLRDNAIEMNEVTFVIRESPEGGYEAHALGHAIVTQADDWHELKYMLRDAVHCHFEAAELPKLINIHFVRDEIIEVGDPVSPLPAFEPPR